jgi:prealbumin domain-containing protein
MTKIVFLSLALWGLIPCLALTQTQPTPAVDGSTGIEGIISMTPIQGGPTRQGEPDSMPLANIIFEVKQNGQVTKSFQTDDRGQFHVELKPGHYTIARKDWKGAVGFYGPFKVEITKGKMTRVEWKCDTGIR